MRTYEDLVVGETATSSALTVELDAMLEFARTYDPQWFHADEAAAKDSVFGEVVASGIYTAALWRKLDHEINGDVDFICGVAWEDTRWHRAVRAGDELRAVSTVMEKRPSKSDPNRGTVIFDYGLIDEENQRVFSCRSINLVRRRLAEG